MKINGLNNFEFIKKMGGKSPKEIDSEKLDTGKSKEVGDKIEISGSAKMVSTNKVSGKDLSEIKQKIDNGFYNSEEVLESVVDKMMRDLR